MCLATEEEKVKENSMKNTKQRSARQRSDLWLAGGLMCLWLTAPTLAHSAVYTVTHTGDAGAGSLRQAITDSNLSAGSDLIHFNITGGTGPYFIRPATALPWSTDPVEIDGYTQPGSAPASDVVPANLQVVLDGSNCGSCDGLVIAGGGSRVRGLVVSHFQRFGVVVGNYGGSIVEGNHIGTNPAGTGASGNGHPNNCVCGLLISDSGHNTVGGMHPEARNVISGNRRDGLCIDGEESVENRVEGNFIGVDAYGSTALPNGTDGEGVSITNGAAFNSIGGPDPALGNVISGNGGVGVFISASDWNQVVFNRIGTDLHGHTGLGNGQDGVYLWGSAHSVIERNLVSANGWAGVELRGSSSSENQVVGNWIGTDAAGTSGLGNGTQGINLVEAPRNFIGHPSDEGRNVVADNDSDGIRVYGTSAVDNEIVGNWIGTDGGGNAALGNGRDGISIDAAVATAIVLNVVAANAGDGVEISGSGVATQLHENGIGVGAWGLALGNQGDGVRVDGATDSYIGGGNTIAYNGQSGVHIASGTRNTIHDSSIVHNGGLGIDLGPSGVTANDSLDADTGANGLQNFPEVRRVYAATGTTAILLALHSTPATTFELVMYLCEIPDASGHGEAQVFLASTSVTTDAGGNGSTTITLPSALPVGTYVTATATDPWGSTSELSRAAVVSGP